MIIIKVSYCPHTHTHSTRYLVRTKRHSLFQSICAFHTHQTSLICLSKSHSSCFSQEKKKGHLSTTQKEGIVWQVYSGFLGDCLVYGYVRDQVANVNNLVIYHVKYQFTIIEISKCFFFPYKLWFSIGLSFYQGVFEYRLFY